MIQWTVKKNTLNLCEQQSSSYSCLISQHQEREIWINPSQMWYGHGCTRACTTCAGPAAVAWYHQVLLNLTPLSPEYSTPWWSSHQHAPLLGGHLTSTLHSLMVISPAYSPPWWSSHQHTPLLGGYLTSIFHSLVVISPAYSTPWWSSHQHTSLLGGHLTSILHSLVVISPAYSTPWWSSHQHTPLLGGHITSILHSLVVVSTTSFILYGYRLCQLQTL